MDSQTGGAAAGWDFAKAAETAKHCPVNWQVAQDARDGTYYCASTQPDAGVVEALGLWVAIPVVILVVWLLRGGRR
jgi:hypothetical protein